jgi:hypothetical protein
MTEQLSQVPHCPKCLALMRLVGSEGALTSFYCDPCNRSATLNLMIASVRRTLRRPSKE